ncbi:acyl-CoA thioesterase [Ketobacter sp.]|uniref:acyl-CoA thioesterase n=1 Tax=Ketobacter sp. TaxID=2083498 RepID=UPI000F10E39D|nr:thioesterase family protein [Ketobacter sp.]RLT96958.1 MAG: acyl-CoA thioesterase [Ketobacter sp.]
MSVVFTYLLKVRYCECDAQQVVFNARYGDYVDTASTEFFRAVFGDYKNLLARGLDCQVVKQTTQWKTSARFDDVLAIAVRATQVGTSSFTLVFELLNHATGATVAQCETVYVMVHAADFTKTPVPDDIRERLLQGAPGVIINHAGVPLADAFS